MTRRIAIAILLSACAMLMAGGIAAYISVWETLVVELDQTLIERATALMRLTQKNDQPGSREERPSNGPWRRAGRGEQRARPHAGATISRPCAQRRADRAQPCVCRCGRRDARAHSDPAMG